MESTTDYAIIATDLAGGIVEWNVGAQAVLGWTAAEIVGLPLQTIFTPEDHVDTAILQIDPSGSIVFSNPAAERLLGWSAAELNGRPAAGLLAAEVSAGADGAPDVGARPFRDGDVLLRTRSGDIKTVTGSQNPIMVDGRTTGAVLTLQSSGRPQQADATLRAEARRHEILARTQRAVESAWGDPDATYRAVVQGALEILPQADAAAIELVDGDATLNFMTTDGALGEPGMRVRLAGSLAGAALSLGQAAICRDTETDDRVDRARSRRFGARWWSFRSREDRPSSGC